MEVDPSRGEVTFESLLRWDCTVFTSCVVARRQTLIDAGLFDPNFYYSEDFDLWLRVAYRGGRLGYLTEVLAHRRSHAESLCANRSRQLEGEITVYEKWLREESLSPAQRELIKRQMEHRRADLALVQGKQRLLAGEYAGAREAFESANNFQPSPKLRLSLLALRFAPQLFRRLYAGREQAFTRKYKAQNTA
jgi:GT2 family glycosyltransferase